MPSTRKPSNPGPLANYLLTIEDQDAASKAMHEELKRQIQDGKLSYRGRIGMRKLLAAAMDAIADLTVERMFPGKPDDPAPFT